MSTPQAAPARCIRAPSPQVEASRLESRAGHVTLGEGESVGRDSRVGPPGSVAYTGVQGRTLWVVSGLRSY